MASEDPAPAPEAPAASTPALNVLTTDAPKLSGAELKKQKQAEKAARRAQTVQQKAPPPVPAGPSLTGSKSEPVKTEKGQQKPRATNSSANTHAPIPVRSKKPAPVKDEPKEEDKTVEFFRHLSLNPKSKALPAGLARAHRDVHPAVQALGLQMSSYAICGSSARLITTLQAFKKVIQSYETPQGNSLTRHFPSHVLRHQVDFLAACRPLSISMGNAIRWLKLEISKVDIDVPDNEAKEELCAAIDSFIQERLTLASQVIATSAMEKIRDGDVILTYAKSSVVERALVQAFEAGKKFSVIVIDSRPLHEGKYLAAALANIGIEVRYCLISGLSHCVRDATKVFLGAHAMMSNGRLFSRVGTALVAMEAKDAGKPLLVLCETIKFTEKTALDSILNNEIAPADELVIPGGALEGWRDIKGLQLCNPMYDVTPAEFIQMIVTESGNVPPTSVPVLHRLGNESQG